MDENDIDGCLGVIEYAKLSLEHGFCLTLGFDFGGMHQGFQFGLGTEEESENRFAVAAIRGVMKAVGVDEWGKLVGKVMIVERENGLIKAMRAPKYVEQGGSFDVRECYKRYSSDAV